MAEFCLCGCGQEIKNDKSMMTDGCGWMLCECVDTIRNGTISKGGCYSPDGIRIIIPNNQECKQ